MLLFPDSALPPVDADEAGDYVFGKKEYYGTTIDVPESELVDYFIKFSMKGPIQPVQHEMMKNRLQTMEHYFNSWLRDFQITEGNIGKMLYYLYEYVRPPTSWEESHFIKCYTAGEMSTLQSAVAPGVEAFLYLKIGNLKMTYTILVWMDKLIEYFRKWNVLSNDYCIGLEYLSRLILAECKMEDESADMATFLNDHSFRYDELEPKAQSIIWVARWKLDQTIHERKSEAVKHLEKVA